jgi:hypothetical protein
MENGAINNDSIEFKVGDKVIIYFSKLARSQTLPFLWECIELKNIVTMLCTSGNLHNKLMIPRFYKDLEYYPMYTDIHIASDEEILQIQMEL